MEILQSLLAGFLDKFKAKNPMVFAGVVLLLLSINYIAANAIDLGLLVEGQLPWLSKTLEIVSQALIILQGSRTVKYIAGPAQSSTNPDYND